MSERRKRHAAPLHADADMEPAKRGRKSLEPGTPTKQWTFKLPQTLLDRVIIRSLEGGVDVNEYIRRALERSVRETTVVEHSTVVRSGRI